jgi:cation:H+ antiporter
VPETVIGLTIVAAGTSLPELAASAMASFRGRHDIAVSNVIGSNIFNVLGIAGVTAMIQPLEVPAEILTRDMWWMIGFSALLFPLMRSGLRVSRLEGAVLLVGFAVYLVVLLAG